MQSVLTIDVRHTSATIRACAFSNSHYRLKTSSFSKHFLSSLLLSWSESAAILYWWGKSLSNLLVAYVCINYGMHAAQLHRHHAHSITFSPVLTCMYKESTCTDGAVM